MIDAILPGTVVVAEVTPPVVGGALLSPEETAVTCAVATRRQEYTSGRACARHALRLLGVPPVPIPLGERGEPGWPDGIVGSITHCAGYCACAVARTDDVIGVGIDAEPHTPLPKPVLGEVASEEERIMLQHLATTKPGVHWDRVLFSAKESVYKVWFPLARRWLGFEDASLSVDARVGTFSARLLVPGPTVPSGELRSLTGRWTVRQGLVLTAMTLLR